MTMHYDPENLTPGEQQIKTSFFYTLDDERGKLRGDYRKLERWLATALVACRNMEPNSNDTFKRDVIAERLEDAIKLVQQTLAKPAIERNYPTPPSR